MTPFHAILFPFPNFVVFFSSFYFTFLLGAWPGTMITFCVSLSLLAPSFNSLHHEKKSFFRETSWPEVLWCFEIFLFLSFAVSIPGEDYKESLLFPLCVLLTFLANELTLNR